jgi:hypothetical protein
MSGFAQFDPEDGTILEDKFSGGELSLSSIELFFISLDIPKCVAVDRSIS